MKASERTSLELAKQGNVQAISDLMNRHLQQRGVTAKIVRKDDCLQILLQSSETPEQEALVRFTTKGIASLELQSVKSLKIYGRKNGEDLPTWTEDVMLSQPFSMLSGFQGFVPQPQQKSDSVREQPIVEFDHNQTKDWIDKLNYVGALWRTLTGSPKLPSMKLTSKRLILITVHRFGLSSGEESYPLNKIQSVRVSYKRDWLRLIVGGFVIVSGFQALLKSPILALLGILLGCGLAILGWIGRTELCLQFQDVAKKKFTCLGQAQALRRFAEEVNNHLY